MPSQSVTLSFMEKVIHRSCKLIERVSSNYGNIRNTEQKDVISDGICSFSQAHGNEVIILASPSS